jgi:hypothetical protein
MSLRLVSVEDREAWYATVEGIGHSYWQRWEPSWAFHCRSGAPVFLCRVDEPESGTHAMCTFAQRQFGGSPDVFTPFGFGGWMGVGDPDVLRLSWQALVAARGYVCGYFALHPELALHEAHDSLRETNTLFVLDLSAGSAEMLARADRSVRRAVRDWDAAGLQYVTARQELTRFILCEYRPFMVSHGANEAALWSEEALSTMCADPDLLMLGASDAGSVCAVYTFGRAGASAECHINVHVGEGRSFTSALLWGGMQELARCGVRWLHMGGGVRRDDAIARAKRKFGPREVPLRVSREVYRPDDYRRLCEAAGLDANAPGFFPAYWRA